MEWLKNLGRKLGQKAPDGFSLQENDPYAAEHREITSWLERYEATPKKGSNIGYAYFSYSLAGDDAQAFETARRSWDDAKRSRIAAAIVLRMREMDRRKITVSFGKTSPFYQFLGWWFVRETEKKQIWNDDERWSALLWYAEADLSVNWYSTSFIVRQAEWFARRRADGEFRQLIAKITRNLQTSSPNFTDKEKQIFRLEKLADRPPEIPLQPGEAWSDAALQALAEKPSAEQKNWARLLMHCRDATAASPSGKWSKAAEQILADLPPDSFKQQIVAWFPLVDKPRTAGLGRPNTEWFIQDRHQDILRGLAWLCGSSTDRELARCLRSLALTSFKKIPGMGPRAVRIGNAAILALGKMPGLDAVGQLALLKVRLKFIPAQNAVQKALQTAADREGMPREDIEEMSVPGYGMTEVGALELPLGDFKAVLKVELSGKTTHNWMRSDGKIQKTLPQAVKTAFSDDLKDLQGTKKDIEKMVAAQSQRIDGLYLRQKSWSLSIWQERYLDHPLVGVVARHLLWVFQIGERRQTGIWLSGFIVGLNGEKLTLDSDQTTVRLWHPLDETPEEIGQWRAFLESREIKQPFKQAHREVYLLTPAEETTRVYSNRFAAHILKQHQFNALCSARGWRNQLRLMVDASYTPPTRRLPEWNLRAEYWVEGAGNQYGTDTNETGTYLYLATDQVRFYRLEDGQVEAHAGGGGYGTGWGQRTLPEPIPLSDIPDLVLSEVLRDVDLFVGVASVGNDPVWRDGGRSEQQRAYWENYSFGDLSTTAKSRREILAKLVPRLKIASLCSFTDKFLVVQGKWHTYKIHFGSGNIQMSPNDQYLCIVAHRGIAEDKLFLPFEGDQTLSVILSKAFLLAADDRITDPTILAQIRRK